MALAKQAALEWMSILANGAWAARES